MTYQGILAHRDGEASLVRRVFPEYLSVNKNITFVEESFRNLWERLQNNVFDFTVLLVEIRDGDTGQSWCRVLKEITARFPYCRVIFVFENSIQDCSQALNQIPFTYLLALKHIDTLLPEALEKATGELSRYFLHHNLFAKKSHRENTYETIAFFTTEGMVHKGKKGCMIHYHNQKIDYTKQSLKTIQPYLPDTFMQVHKSYIVNMDYCQDIVRVERPIGSEKDKYILLSCLDGLTIPLGPKYEPDVRDYIMDKYAVSCLGDLQYSEI